MTVEDLDVHYFVVLLQCEWRLVVLCVSWEHHTDLLCFFFFLICPSLLIHPLLLTSSISQSICHHIFLPPAPWHLLPSFPCLNFSPYPCLAMFISPYPFLFIPFNLIVKVFQSTVVSPPKSSSFSTLWRDQSDRRWESSLLMTLRSFWMVSWPESIYIASIKSIHLGGKTACLCLWCDQRGVFQHQDWLFVIIVAAEIKMSHWLHHASQINSHGTLLDRWLFFFVCWWSWDHQVC